jgi:hypothetical protein
MVCFDSKEDVRCKDAPNGRIISQTTWCAGDPTGVQSPPPPAPVDDASLLDDTPAEGMEKMWPLVGAGYRTEFCGGPPEGWKVGQVQLFGGMHWTVGLVTILFFISCVAICVTTSFLRLMKSMFVTNYAPDNNDEEKPEDGPAEPTSPPKPKQAFRDKKKNKGPQAAMPSKQMVSASKQVP